VIVLSIDPGYAKASKGCACAATTGQILTGVWFTRPENHTRFTRHVSAVVVEKPQWDGRDATAQVLIELTYQGALLAGLYAGEDGADVIAYTPRDWKGSEPKPVHHGRLWKILDADERAILGGDRTGAIIQAAKEKGALNRWARPGVTYYPRNFETHNLLDAAALNLFHLGRLPKI
jgi:hypothetical protein